MIRPRLRAALPLAALLAAPATTPALERVSAPAPAEGSPWAAGATTATIRYYNICTGWIWIWGGWEDGDMVGTVFEAPACTYPLSSQHYLPTGAPSGYGFTGTISVRGGEACDAPLLASQPFLPVSGWNTVNWPTPAILPDAFLVMFSVAAPAGVASPMSFASDHPQAGPTGPQACGTCYPSTRAGHAFYFGTDGDLCDAPLPMRDSICDVELLASVTVGTIFDCSPTKIDPETWAAVKALYR